MTYPFPEELRDPNSPRVQAALKRGCPICEAKPATPCNNLLGEPLLESVGRVVHFLRADNLPFGSEEGGKKRWAA